MSLACTSASVEASEEAQSEQLRNSTELIPLSRFGLVADTDRDMTEPLQRAFAQAAGACLDGGGRSYVVRGTLRASADLCLHNIRLLQRAPINSTKAWIKGSCPVARDTASQLDCGDPPITPSRLEALRDYTSRRTLFISPGPRTSSLQVALVNVFVDRGDDPRSGSRDNAAAIWIDHASRVRLEDVEITGSGKGHGIIIANSQNVASLRLHVHDMVWAPYEGDTQLRVEEVRRKGWNRPTVRELIGSGGRLQFKGVRVQEQLSCITIVASHHVRLRDTRVMNCGARFIEGDLPWQADGINIGASSSDVHLLGDTVVSGTWEGIDVVGSGSGMSDIVIDGAHVSNSFAVGIKMGHRLTAPVLRNSSVAGSGLAGVMVYGAVTAARLKNLTISSLGTDVFPLDMRSLWPGSRAGLAITAEENGAVPARLDLENVRIAGDADCAAGVLDSARNSPSLSSVSISGCKARYERR